MPIMTDDDRREYLRHLEEIARNGYRAWQIDAASWALDRHMSRPELALVRAWRALVRVCSRP